MSRQKPDFNAAYQTGNGKKGRGEFAEQLAEQIAPTPKVEPQTEKTVRLSFDIPQSVHRRIKIHCASEGEKIRDVLNELLAERFVA